ncbi:MAG: transglutaminase family protein [Verrucomicrobiaceae bacterium]
MQLKIYHRTEYQYHTPVHDSINELKLSPRDDAGQVCKSCIVSVVPPVKLNPYVDLNGNRAHHFEVPEPHRRLVIEARMRMETAPSIEIEDLPYGVEMSTLKELEKKDECRPFLQSSPYVDVNPEVWREAVDIMDESSDVFQTSYAIMAFIFGSYSYDPGATVVTTHANEVIRKRHGVCQDFAHAMVALCRSLGIPARYVSGYFFDATRDSSLRGSEATHAWVEVYVEGHGWIGLDPTNNKVIDDTYIVLATGRDYSDVAPVSGSYYGGGTSGLKVHVAVRRVG